MYDIDPPARILRFPETKPTAKPKSPTTFPAQMDAYLADRWARLHAPDPAVLRLRAEAEAEGDLARRIGAL